mgnify:CR=1 FL=1
MKYVAMLAVGFVLGVWRHRVWAGIRRGAGIVRDGVQRLVSSLKRRFR